jgi:osmoprotectant transport system substrate-binding protein
VSVVAGKDLPRSPERTATEAQKFYEGRGQTVIGPTPFQDVDVIATTKDFATKNNLKSLADLKNLPSFSLGARPEFKSRFTGLVGMREEYGITNAKFKQLALGLQYQALDKGDVDAANVFSTDAQLASGKYTLLEDPEGIFGFQNVHFVIDKAKYDALGGQAFGDVIASVNKLLTNDAMQSMNSAVDIDKKDPKAVAGQFLKANGLSGSAS